MARVSIRQVPVPNHRLHLLFGVGCFRVAWYATQSEPFRLMLEAVEWTADGGPRPDVAFLRGEDATEAGQIPWDAAEALRFAAYTGKSYGYHGAEESAARVAVYIRWTVPGSATLLARLRQDILAVPECPPFESDWFTPTVVALARGMYESRDFTGTPALADELQEAGCDIPVILDHCRDPNGVHARGCWVVDHILGKA